MLLGKHRKCASLSLFLDLSFLFPPRDRNAEEEEEKAPSLFAPPFSPEMDSIAEEEKGASDGA